MAIREKLERGEIIVPPHALEERRAETCGDGHTQTHAMSTKEGDMRAQRLLHDNAKA